MKFHKRVPSFSFTTFSFNNEQQQQQQQQQTNSQPNSPNRTNHIKLPQPPLSANNPTTSLQQQQQQQTTTTTTTTTSRQINPITLLLSAEDPLQFIISQSTTPTSNRFRKRAGSLVESPSHSKDSPPSENRRSSLADTFNHLVLPDRGRRLSNPANLQLISCPTSPATAPPAAPAPAPAPALVPVQAPPTPSSSSSSHFTRHRKRLSNLFSPLTSYHHHNNASRSPSPANSHSRHRNNSTQSLDPAESDRESNLDPHSTIISPQIDLPSSESEDDSDSNLSHSDRSDQPELSDSEEDETILANTHANASSITPIDFLQKSNQPIPFIDQAPNITSPPPLPISFVPSDPTRFPSAVTTPTPILNPTRKSSLTNRSSIRRRTSSIGARQSLKLTVSRPIYQKNRCTITIEHGDWMRAVEKAERTRFYLVACDLSDESKYAIEWTIGTVLRQGDECLIIMIIETDSKFDPEDGAGSAADRTAKIRNQKDRQEKATLLVREATSLLERTGLHAKVTCQAVHGKNPKHMLVDCIDYLEPNLVIVGRRGMTSAKGSLMGSVSHYLVQKSSVPVMVARRRLRTLPKVYKKKHGLVSLPSQTKLTEASIEKTTNLNHHDGIQPITSTSMSEGKRLSVVSEEIDMKLQLAQAELELAQSQLCLDNHTHQDVAQMLTQSQSQEENPSIPSQEMSPS